MALKVVVLFEEGQGGDSGVQAVCAAGLVLKPGPLSSHTRIGVTGFVSDDEALERLSNLSCVQTVAPTCMLVVTFQQDASRQAVRKACEEAGLSVQRNGPANHMLMGWPSRVVDEEELIMLLQAVPGVDKVQRFFRPSGSQS